MSDLSRITGGLTIVAVLYLYTHSGSRWLPVRKPILGAMHTSLLAASLIALAFETFTFLAPAAAKSLHPGWYLFDLAAVALLVGVACGAWIVDRRLGPPQS